MYYFFLLLLQTKIGESENILSAGLVSVVKKADRKLTFIPIVFVLLRMWGTIQFFYSLAVARYIKCACTTPGISLGFELLGYLQVSTLMLLDRRVVILALSDFVLFLWY